MRILVDLCALDIPPDRKVDVPALVDRLRDKFRQDVPDKDAAMTGDYTVILGTERPEVVQSIATAWNEHIVADLANAIAELEKVPKDRWFRYSDLTGRVADKARQAANQWWAFSDYAVFTTDIIGHLVFEDPAGQTVFNCCLDDTSRQRVMDCPGNWALVDVKII